MKEFKIIKDKSWIIGIKNEYENKKFLDKIKGLFLNPIIEKDRFPSRGVKPVFSFKYNDEEFIFRFYQHGGFIKKIFKDIFFFNLALKEIRIIEELKTKKFLTYEPVGFISRRYFKVLFRTALVTKRMLGYESLLTYLKDKKSLRRKEIIERLINVLENLYKLNLYHNDLNVKNLLINPKDFTICIIDWKKCSLKNKISLKGKIRNITRLARSLEKNGIKINDRLKMRFFLRFIKRFGVSNHKRKRLMRLCKRNFYLHRLTWHKQEEKAV